MFKNWQFFPIFTLLLYLTEYPCTYYDWYYDIYSSVVVKLDMFFLIGSLVGAFFYHKQWKNLAIVSFITVVVLNILTEIDFRTEIKYYYEIYLTLIIAAFMIMIAFSATKHH